LLTDHYFLSRPSFNAAVTDRTLVTSKTRQSRPPAETVRERCFNPRFLAAPRVVESSLEQKQIMPIQRQRWALLDELRETRYLGGSLEPNNPMLHQLSRMLAKDENLLEQFFFKSKSRRKNESHNFLVADWYRALFNNAPPGNQFIKVLNALTQQAAPLNRYHQGNFSETRFALALELLKESKCIVNYNKEKSDDLRDKLGIDFLLQIKVGNPGEKAIKYIPIQIKSCFDSADYFVKNEHKMPNKYLNQFFGLNLNEEERTPYMHKGIFTIDMGDKSIDDIYYQISTLINDATQKRSVSSKGKPSGDDFQTNANLSFPRQHVRMLDKTKWQALTGLDRKIFLAKNFTTLPIDELLSMAA